MMAMTSQFRKLSTGCAPARKEISTEPIRLSVAMNPKITSSAMLTPNTIRERSAFSYSRIRACSRSSRVMSSLLLHVPDHEDESELAQRDHERHDDVEQLQDEAGPALADQRHA